MAIHQRVNDILEAQEALEAHHQRCTYNALAELVECTLPELFSALGMRRPRASWIVNQGTLEPTGFLANQEHPSLYAKAHVISKAAELAAFLESCDTIKSTPSITGQSDVVCYGVDGCKGGWVYARLEKESLTLGTVKTIADLVAKAETNSRIFIDIPIGLRDDSPQGRLCDIGARKLLKPYRTSSVFNAPIRTILNESSHRTASEASRQLIGKGISQQTFNIMKKIGEVDELMISVPDARKLIREVHPEVCFYGLASGVAMKSNKKTKEGFAERLALIEKHLPVARGKIDAALAHYPRKQVAADDILDSVVAVITAAISENWATVPENPEIDSKGIPMEIVYLKFQ